MRDTILRATGGLDDETFRTTGTESSARDLRTTLVHELDVESSWRQRLIGGREQAELQAGAYPMLASLSEHWHRDEIEMRAWLSGLTDADLAAPPQGATDRLPLSDYLLHVVGHGIEEFTEAALLLRHAGSPPDAIKFLEYADPRPDPGIGRPNPPVMGSSTRRGPWLRQRFDARAGSPDWTSQARCDA